MNPDQQRLPHFAYPPQGTVEFGTGLKTMLAEYEKAKDLETSRRVKTNHGNVAEAAFRKWLGSFLPKKYGVTAGYVISASQPMTTNLPHFDVIIYDAMEAPILWVQDVGAGGDESTGNPAIPAEYVKAVIEVKSSMTKTTIKEGTNHLLTLKPLTEGADPPQERYKVYLPPGFFSALVFFEVPQSVRQPSDVLDAFRAAFEWDRFHGGTVLQERFSSSVQPSNVARVGRVQQLLYVAGPGAPQDALTSDPYESPEGRLALEYNYLKSFSGFAFDMLALLNGTYEPGRASTNHAYAF